MEVIDQDDLCFADLNRQISLLIMDDDDADHISSPPAVTYQVFSRVDQTMEQSIQVFYEQSKGTGVFIPRSTHRRRKSRPQRSKATNNATKPNHNYISEGLLLPQHQLPYNNYTSYNSMNYKRV